MVLALVSFLLLLLQLLLVARALLDWSTVLAGPATAGGVRARLMSGVHAVTEPILEPVRADGRQPRPDRLPPVHAGTGSAAYVSTRLGPDGLAPVLGDLLARAGVTSELPAELRGQVELAVRGDTRFVINRTEEPVDLSALGEAGRTLTARGVAVLRA